MSTDLALRLNQAQLQAVAASGGHLLINAAAGTGKTSTIAARIVYLQAEHKVPASSILAISFSRATKSQISEKVDGFCRETGYGSPVRTYTFHGLAFRILRLAVEAGETWLRPGFTVLESNANLNRIHHDYSDLLFNISEEFPPESRQAIYSRALDSVRQGCVSLSVAILNPSDLPANRYVAVSADMSARNLVATDDIRKVWHSYNKLLRKHNCIDYPGMITEAVKVLSYGNGYTRSRVCNGLQHIIVDEYQDTSKAQEALLLALAGSDIFVTAVGDNDQNIYSFNGSDVSNILQFSERFSSTGKPVLETVSLVENYRSTANILLAANRVICKGNRSYLKVLVPARDFLPEPLASYRAKNIPVTLVNTQRLELAADFVACEIRNLLGQGITTGEIAVLVRKDSEFSPQARTVRELLDSVGVTAVASKVDPGKKKMIEDAARNLCQYHYGESLSDLLGQLQSGAIDDELGEIESQEVADLLQVMLVAGAEFAYEAAEMLYDNGEIEETDTEVEGVKVCTIHSCKGREFRVVFLLYLGDRSFPHGVCPDTDEERRLLYVGITRAQERIYIIGRPGVHGPDFLGDCYGAGTTVIEYTVPGGQEAEGLPGMSELDVASVQRARRQQAVEEARRQVELEKMFDNENWL